MTIDSNNPILEEVVKDICKEVNNKIIPNYITGEMVRRKLSWAEKTLGDAVKDTIIASSMKYGYILEKEKVILVKTINNLLNESVIQIRPEDIMKSLEPISDTYIILQLKEEKLRDIGFESMSFLKKHNIPVVRENYNVVYSAPLVPQMLDQENGGDSSTLERIFEIFNINRPDDFKGHSLSVSDVVVIVKDDNITPYYIDRIGSYQLNRDFIERSEVKDIAMAAQERAVNQSSRIVNKFFYNMAQSCRELAKKGSNKEEMLSKAKVYEFLATCTKEDIDNIYNSGVFNEMTEAFARKALFFQQVDYNTAGNIIAEIKSLHDMETISNVRTWNNTVNEKDWNDNIERNATASIRKDEYSM